MKTASFCVPSFWHNTGVWGMDGQTNGRICCSLYSKHAVINEENIFMQLLFWKVHGCMKLVVYRSVEIDMYNTHSKLLTNRQKVKPSSPFLEVRSRAKVRWAWYWCQLATKNNTSPTRCRQLNIVSSESEPDKNQHITLCEWHWADSNRECIWRFASNTWQVAQLWQRDLVSSAISR